MRWTLNVLSECECGCNSNGLAGMGLCLVFAVIVKVSCALVVL